MQALAAIVFSLLIDTLIWMFLGIGEDRWQEKFTVAVTVICMGIAAYLVWRKVPQHKGAKVALFIYLGQLALILIFSIPFTGSTNPVFTFARAISLWIAAVTTDVAFARVSSLAAWLAMPYVLLMSTEVFLGVSGTLGTR